MPRGNGVRDRRSVEWDSAIRTILAQAVRQMRERKGVVIWVASPREQFRAKDAGGRTTEERAFTRAAYYHVFAIPRGAGVPPDYSLRLTWGDVLEPSSHGRRARACRVRLYRYGSGYTHVRDKVADPWYVEVEDTGDSSFRRRRETLSARQAPAPPKIGA